MQVSLKCTISDVRMIYTLLYVFDRSATLTTSATKKKKKRYAALEGGLPRITTL